MARIPLVWVAASALTVVAGVGDGNKGAIRPSRLYGRDHSEGNPQTQQNQVSSTLGPRTLFLKARLRSKIESADEIIDALERRGHLRSNHSETSLQELGESNLTSVAKIFYVKTHATGSSTLSNILHRFCDTHSVRCYVPPKGLSAGHTVTRHELKKYMQTKESKNLHVWPNHVVLETDLVNELIPGAVKISIFREPASRVVSSYSHPGKADLLEAVVHDLKHNKDVTGGSHPCGPQGIRMSEHVRPNDFAALDFVLLTEKYDLSLVMLRRRFGWKTKDIVYLPIKDSQSGADEGFDDARDQLEAYLRKPPDDMTPAGRKLMKECVLGDEAKVYELAVKRFDMQWASLGIEEQLSITDEAQLFVQILDELRRCCKKNPDDSLCISLSMDMWPWVQKERSALFLVEESVCQAAIVEYDDFSGAA